MTKQTTGFDPVAANPPAIQRFLKSKVKPPRISIQTIDRKRLLDKLDAALNTPITYVIAPAGFGKSTILSQWRDTVVSQGTVCAWVNLDDNDQEIRQFFTSLVLAFAHEGLNLDSLSNMAELGFVNMSAQGIGEEILIAIDNLPEPVVLILDDFHRVEVPEIDDFIQTLYENCYDNIRLVLASRNWIGSHRVEKIVSGNAIDIPSSELLFTDEEAKQVLGEEFDETMGRDLQNQAEGWPVAVQMMRALGIQGSSLRTSLNTLQSYDGDMISYLTQQVLNDLPDELQDFLLKTSILNRFHSDLANRICDRQDSGAILHRLKSLNALILPIDENFEWHRYHHLFSQYLREILKLQKPAEYIELHHRAAKWFEENGYISEAVEYTNAINDYQSSTEIILRNGSWRLGELIGEGYLSSLFLEIPEEVIQQNAGLLYTKAYVYSCSGDLKRALTYRDAAEALIEEKGATPENIEDRLTIGMTVLCRMELNASIGIPLMEAGLAMAEPDDKLSIGIIHAVLTGMHNDRAQFETSGRHAEQAIADLTDLPTPVPMNSGHIQYGLNGLFSGDMALAREQFEQALQIMSSPLAKKTNMRHMAEVCVQTLNYWQGTAGADGLELLRLSLFKILTADAWFEIYAIGFDALFHHAISEGDFDCALALVNKLDDANDKFGIDRIDKFCGILRLDLYLYQGRLGAAEIEYNAMRKWHALEEDEAEVYFWFLRIKGAFTRAKFLAAIGNMDDALALVDEAILKAEFLNVILTNVEGLVLKAVLLLEIGEDKKAATALANAIKLAAPRHWETIFLGRDISRKIWRTVATKIQQEQLGPLTIEFLETVSAIDRKALLTKRELQVLRALSEGMTNREIARNLGLTENTVKFHIKGVFTKLNVTKRIQAAAMGRKLDLIP